MPPSNPTVLSDRLINMQKNAAHIGVLQLHFQHLHSKRSTGLHHIASGHMKFLKIYPWTAWILAHFQRSPGGMLQPWITLVPICNHIQSRCRNFTHFWQQITRHSTTSHSTLFILSTNMNCTCNNAGYLIQRILHDADNFIIQMAENKRIRNVYVKWSSGPGT